MKKSLPFIAILLLLISCQKQNKTPELIPFPKQIEMKKGSFTFDSETKIVAADSLQTVSTYLQKIAKQHTGFELTLSKEKPQSKSIFIEIDSCLHQEEYQLIVNQKDISIKGNNVRALLLGIQTLQQLFYLSENQTLPCLQITDAPEWHYRGMHLDISRHFFDKEEVKEYLDLMALYKFNKFHWHLTDDQGWRVEIKKYPELTEKGAWRTFNEQDSVCIKLAEKEQNPDLKIPESKLRTTNGITEYGGFYTQDEIKEIVAYAAERGIDVIPEIDMPGHFTSAIKVFPDLACFDEASWGAVFSSPICPGKDATLDFCKDIFSEIFELFPYKNVHVGADEVEQAYWHKCPHCQKRISENHLTDEHELHAWFVREMEYFFHENNKKMIGWDEIADGGLSESATMMWWRTWVKKNVIKAIEQKNEVILAPNSNYYFDYKQNRNTLKDLYAFNPVPAEVSETQRKSIKGVQANLWAEYIPSPQRIQYQIFPRILALSETAWNDTKRSDWECFKKRLIKQFDILDALNVNYRPLDLENIEQVNVFVGDTIIEWENPLPNVIIRYTTDGSVPNENSTLYNAPIKLSETTDFTIRYFRPNGTAADIVKTTYRKENYREAAVLENPKKGLRLNWHETVANKIADIEQVSVKESFVVDGIVVPETVGGKRGLVYSGYLNVPKEAIYTFILTSDDGSKLYIHDETVVDNDFAHGPITVSGQMALKKGLHPIKLYYFDMNNGGMLNLKCVDNEGVDVFIAENVYN